MAGNNYSVNLKLNADASGVKSQLDSLQKQLQQISTMKIDVNTGNLTQEIQAASEAAMKLSAHLATATNPQTGNLDFTKFYSSIQKSGASLEEYGKALQNMGPAGQKAFVSLADSISKAEIPLKRTNKLIDGMWDNLKKTVGWQISSSMIHGFIGSVQQAVGYAKDLDRSLNDIRIVTGASSDQMTKFAREANKAAKTLSTTTTDYTRASLIYYQQGLGDAEVKQRTEATIKMANATGQSAQIVSDQMTAIWNNFDNGTKSLEYYGDAITALGAKTASSTDEISEGLQKFASVADTIGLSYEYATSALATITATTRESASTVGTALRTLFSRLQSLQLGETLDDGTSLNKYSSALMTAGINIKDANGGLKDMDTILDELGGKWDTLGKDQQVALAQTVAGVRQYTQLVTLMDNWDFFKSNVMTAKTSEGTLDQQAAIYAESWQAASDRVRASWEGLWDNLIDSDSFITILDGISAIVGLMDNFTTGIGGAGGALLSFGGILTKTFNKQIAGTINDVVFSVKALSPSYLEDMEDKRKKFIQEAKDSISPDAYNSLYGEEEAKIRKKVLDDTLDRTLDYARRKDYMTEEEKIAYNQKSQQLQRIDQMLIDAGAEVDLTKNAVADSYYKFFDKKLTNNKLKQKLGDLYEKEFSEEEENLQEETSNKIIPFKPKEQQIQENFKQPGKIPSEAEGSQQSQPQNIKNQLEGFNENNIENLPGFIQKDIEAFNNFKAELQKENLNFDGELERELSDSEKEKYKKYLKLEKNKNTAERLQGLGLSNKVEDLDISQIMKKQSIAINDFKNSLSDLNDSEGLDEAIKRFEQIASFSGSDSDFMKNLKGMTTADGTFDKNYINQFKEAFFKNLNNNSASAISDLLGITDEKERETLAQLQNNYLNAEDAKTKEEALNAFRDRYGRNPDGTKPEERDKNFQTKTEAAVAGAEGLMEAAAAGQALQGLVDTLEAVSSGAMTAGEGLTAVASSMGSLAMNSLSGFSSMSKALQDLTGLSAGFMGAGGISAAITAIMTLLPIAIDHIDKATVSTEEYRTSLTISNEEMSQAVNITKDLSQTTAQQNETYLDAIKQIESYSQDPATKEADIYNANQMALDLIDQYSLSPEQYQTMNNGLIKINEEALTSAQEIKDTTSNQMDRVGNLASTLTNLDTLASQIKETEDLLDKDKALRKAYDNPGSQEYRAFVGGGLGIEFNQGYALYKEKKRIDERINNREGLLKEYEVKQTQRQFQLNEIGRLNASQILKDESISSGIQGYNNILQSAAKAYTKQLQQSLETSSFTEDLANSLNTDQIKKVEEYLKSIGKTGVEVGKAVNGRIQYTSDQGADEITVATMKYYEAETAAAEASSTFANTSKDFLKTVGSKDEGIGEKGAVGLFSYLTGNNFQEATLSEIKASETAINSLANVANKSDLEKWANGLGTSIGELQSLTGQSDDTIFTYLKELGDFTLPPAFNQLETVLSKYKAGTDFMEQDTGLYNYLTEKSASQLTEKLQQLESFGGEQAGENFLTGLTNFLNSTDLTDTGIQQALSSIMELDFSQLNVDDAVIEILRNLGIEVNTATASWQAFAAAMTSASTAIPDFSGLIEQLTTIGMLLKDIKNGDSISDELVQWFNDNDMSNLIAADGKGGFTFVGGEEGGEQAREQLWEETITGAQSYQKRRESAEKYLGTRDAAGNLQGGQISADDLTVFKNGLTFKEGYSTSGVAGMIADDLAISNPKSQYAGNLIAVKTALANGYFAQNRIDALNSETGIQVSDIGTITQDENGNFFVDGNKIDNSYEKWDDINDWYNTQQGYIQDAIILTQVGNNLYGEDFAEGTEVNNENIIATAKTMSDAIKTVNENATGTLLDAEGKWADGVAEGLRAKAQQYGESVQAAYEAYESAIESGIGIEEAQYNLELAASIEEVAAARGLDAETIAAEAAGMTALKDAGISAKDVANAAAENVAAKEAVDELAKSYQQLNKDIKSADYSKQNKALWTMQQLFSKIAKVTDVAGISQDELNKKFSEFFKTLESDEIQDFLNGSGKAIRKWQAEVAKLAADKVLAGDGLGIFEGLEESFDSFQEKVVEFDDQIDLGQSLQEALGSGSQAAQDIAAGYSDTVNKLMDAGMGFNEATDLMSDAFGFTMVPVETGAEADVRVPYVEQDQESSADENGAVDIQTISHVEDVRSSQGTTKYKYYKLVKTGKGVGAGNSSGGGGGGGKAKTPKRTARTQKSSVVKRYHANTARRANVDSAKKMTEQRKDVAYGQARIDNLKEINKLTAEQVKLNEQRLDEAQKYLAEDKNRLREIGSQYGLNFKFDFEGTIENYEEEMSKFYDRIAELEADGYIEQGEEGEGAENEIMEELKIQQQELEGAIDDYESTLEEIRKIKEEQQELLFEMFENKVEQVMYKVEFEVELDEDSIKLLDFMIEAMGDSAYKAIDIIDLMNQKAETLYEGIDTYKTAIDELFALSDDPLHSFVVGSNIEGLLTQDQADALRENRDGLIDYSQQLLALREDIESKVIDTFDKWTEKIDANLSSIEHYSSVLNYLKSTFDMLDKSALGVTDKYIRDLESAIIKQSNDSIEANKQYYESLMQTQKDAEIQLIDARSRGDIESTEHWEEVVMTTTEAMQSAQDAMMSALENSISLITDQFAAAVEDIMDEFYNSIYENGFEGLSADYDRARESADLIAEDYDKIYQLSKLNRQINKALDDTKIIAGKEKLRKLQKEINDLQKSNVEMSKYELEYLEAEYNLRMAEIELENARNEKDTVRLQKDSEGNWSYVYTQNEEKVDEAQQKYEDALYAMQNMSYEYMEEMSSAVMDTAQQMAEEIAGLRLQDYENEQAYYDAIRDIQNKYAETMALQQAELDKTISNNKQLYDEDWLNYHNLTNYKISENQRWVDSFAETTLGQLMGSESVEADFAENILNMTDVLAENLAAAAADYFKQIGETLDTYGTSIDDFANHITSSTNQILSDSNKATSAVKDMSQEMVSAFREITDEVAEWQQTFGEDIKELVAEITTLIESINEALERAAHLETEIGSGETLTVSQAMDELSKAGINLNGMDMMTYKADLESRHAVLQAKAVTGELSSAERAELEKLEDQIFTFSNIYNRISTFDTGGYTGEWGSSGRFAMLHEKELVLNANDTKNFLEALDISRQLIEMIELNAKQSSMGLGEMVASTIKENSQVIEQSVQITAEFPNASDHNEIEEAFDNLINTASQYAFRRN